MAKCLVTGGAGFIGSNLARGLLREGHEVTVLDNFLTGKRDNLREIESDIRIVEGDIRNREGLEKLLEGIEYVFHQAAMPSVAWSIEDPWSSHDFNINGTLSVLLAARNAQVRRVIYAASSSAYGNSVSLPNVETMRANPLSPYAVTKYVGELYCHVFSLVYGVETVALRYSNVFGPRQNRNLQYASAIPRFILTFLKGEAPVIFGDGEQTRDFTFVANVVSANLAAVKAPAQAVSGNAFNIGCGQQISVNRLAKELQDLLKVTIEPIHVEPRAGEVRHSQADISLARQALGYEPRVSFREGLEQTIAYFRQNP